MSLPARTACAAVGVRVGQRHRADLVDHGRRVAVGDARELVARARRVELLVVGDLAEVEVEDVAPVLPGRRAEVDVAAHAARAVSAGSSALERHVGGADEVDLLGRAASAACRRSARLPTLLRDDVERVEEGVDAVGEDALASAAARRCRPSATSSWLSASPPPAAHAAGIMKLVDRARRRRSTSRRVDGAAAARRASRTSGRARRAVSSTRSPSGVSAPLGPEEAGGRGSAGAS